MQKIQTTQVATSTDPFTFEGVEVKFHHKKTTSKVDLEIGVTRQFLDHARSFLGEYAPRADGEALEVFTFTESVRPISMLATMIGCLDTKCLSHTSLGMMDAFDEFCKWLTLEQVIMILRKAKGNKAFYLRIFSQTKCTLFAVRGCHSGRAMIQVIWNSHSSTPQLSVSTFGMGRGMSPDSKCVLNTQKVPHD